MNILPLLATLSLTGCATSIEELMMEAEECVDNSNNVSVQGIVTKPTDVQTRECWADVNKRIEVETKKEKRLNGKCPRGQTLICDMRYGDKSCSCMDSWRIRQMLGGR